MQPLLDLVEPLHDFIEAGGYVLWAILCVSVWIWALVFERYLYLRFGHRAHLERVVSRWAARCDKTSWRARKIRQKMLAELSLRLHRSLPLIGTLIAICPLLGLLGTVNGMIHVFDVMAALGTGNPRAMAAGVSLATIPTMAGMVVAISALVVRADLRQRAAAQSRKAAALVCVVQRVPQ